MGAAETRLDAAVQSGRITQAVADERLEAVTEQVTDVVNGTETDDDDSADDADADDADDSGTTTETTTG